jgi:DNA-binding transcriptional MerR regulator
VADSQELLKIRELVERSGLPEAEVKRHVRNFGEFFTTTRQGRTRLYASDSVVLLKRIADLTATGTTIPCIRGVLRGTVTPGTCVPDLGMGVILPPGAAVQEKGETADSLTLGVLSDISMLQASVREIQEEVAVLRVKLTEQEQRTIAHQQQIKLLRHELDDRKMGAMADRLDRQEQPFWKRLVQGNAQKKL